MTIDNIKKIVEQFKEHLLPAMIEGKKYYGTDNPVINSRRKTFFNVTRHEQQEDYTKANNRLASSFTKKIVDQKVMYLVNNNTTITDDSEGSKIEDVLSVNKFKKKLKSVAKNASNEYYGVVQWYINNNKELQFKVIDSKQIIVIHDIDDEDLIDTVVRCYKRDGIEFVEVYDDMLKNTYVVEDGKYILVATESNLSVSKSANGNVLSTKEYGWGKPPFAVMYNNEEKQNDIKLFKTYMDMYDIVISDFGNNFEDYQEMYWVLKNYNGQDAAEFVKEFKESRIVKVGGDGDANQVAQEVPAMSRETFLNLLRHDIYSFAMAVDMETIKGDVTNETIRAMYSDLDLKASDFEMELIDFFDQCMYFVNRYNEINGKAPVEASISFTRNKIVNEKDAIDNIIKQVGFRAKSQLLAITPGVTDVEEELEALAEEAKQNVNTLETPFEG